ncbi:PKD domain-containing protein [Methanosarcina sp. T3]|uniref:PKD domain-containing protein n=1 Tax=Methanosarcina sp. T3 TaxID=3439062 RepID=UPI003F8355E4
MVANGDFETGDLTGWLVNSGSAGDIVSIVSGAPNSSSTYVVRMYSTDDPFASIAQTVDLTGVDYINLSMKYTTSGSGGDFAVYITNSTSTYAAHTEVLPTTSSADWSPRSIDVSAYTGASFISIRAYEATTYTEMWVDDITINSTGAGVDATPNGVVLDYAGHCFHTYDMHTGTHINVVPSPNPAWAGAPSDGYPYSVYTVGRKAYVLFVSDTPYIGVFDIDEFEYTDMFPIPDGSYNGWNPMCISSDGTKALVTETITDNVYVLDLLDSGAVLHTFDSLNYNWGIYDGTDDYIYAFANNIVYKYDASNYSELANRNIGNTVYGVTVNDNTLLTAGGAVFDTINLTDFTSTGYGSTYNYPYMMADQQNEYIYLGSDSQTDIRIFNDETKALETAHIYPSGTTRGIDVSGDGREMYAVIYSPAGVQTFNTSTQALITSFPDDFISTTFGNSKPVRFAFYDEAAGLNANFIADPLYGNSPLSVDFTDLSTGSVTNWYWDFGDGTNSTSENPSHTYTSSGIYTVKLRVSNAVDSNWENKSNYIYVAGTGGSSVTADFHANVTSTGVGNQIQFFDDSAGSPDSWEWDFTNDGIVDSTAENPIVTYGTIGTFSVALTVYNGTDADSKTKYNYITITSGGPGCLGCDFSANKTTGQYPLTVQFADLSTGSPDEWSWNFGDGGTSTEQNPVHTYMGAGSYTVTFTASALNGTVSKTKVKTNYITVTEPTIAGVDFTANVTYGTAPLTVLFTDQSDESATSWTWEIDGVYQTNTQDMIVTFNDAGIYSITHTATNAEGIGTETKTNYIQVYPANYGGIYGYIYDADTSQPISSVNCQFSNSSATATTLSDSDGYYYFWPVYNGVYELTVSKSGYTTGTLPNTIINGTTLRQDIFLTQSGDLVQDENITNYSSDWLNFNLYTDENTKSITLDYEVTQGNTNYANCTIYDDSGPVYSSNVSTQSGTFSYTGSAGNNYLVSFDVMNSEGNRYSGAYPVLFFRGFPSSNPIFPPDMPQGLINGILVFAAIVCMMMFGKAYIEIGMILGTAVLVSSYIWGFLNLPETVQTPVIIFLSALVAGGEYIAKKKVLG